MPSRKHFGDVLLEAGVIDAEKFRRALERVEATGKRLGEVVVDLGYASEEDVLRCLGEHLGYAVVRLEHTYIDPDVARSLPEPFCRNELVLPLYRADGRTVVALCDPLDIVAVDEVRKAIGTEIEALVAGRSDLLRAIDRVFRGEARVEAAAPSPAGGRAAVPPPIPAELLAGRRAAERAAGGGTVRLGAARPPDAPIVEEGMPVAKILEGIFNRALSDRVSSVHLEPKARHMAVRFKIDGQFQTLTSVPGALAGPIVARLKLLAGIDVGERAVEPVEGRFHIRTGVSEPPIEVRVAIAPTLYGERAVLAVTRRADVLRPLETLGLEEDQYRHVKRILEAKHGLVLVSGPAGAGRATTLYSLLGAIDRPEVNILTAEDPVEYPVPSFNQMRLPPPESPSFDSVVRAIERQGPDVVLLAEVRDRKTTAAALRLAETGRLVFTSIHADDAVTAYWPLFRWGADPHAVASVLVGSIAVRLVRLVCDSCAESVRPSPDVRARLGLHDREYRRGRGCDACHGTGYRGRTGLFEVFVPAAHLRDLISGRATSDVVRKTASEAGMTTLREAGIAKVQRGLTTPEEILRVAT